MKTRKNALTIAIAALLLAAASIAPGCKKSEKDEVKDYTFSLKLGSPIQQANVVLYNSKEDYYNLVNPVVSGRTDAEGTYIIPASRLVKGATYYADIYTDDYSYSNWSGGNLIRDFVYGDNNSFSNYGFKKTLDAPNEGWRVFFLGGNELSTNWKAIDARIPGVGSVWNSISAADQLKRITFKRNFTAIYTEKDSTLTDVVVPFTYWADGQTEIPGIGLANMRKGITIDTVELITEQLKYYFIKE